MLSVSAHSHRAAASCPVRVHARASRPIHSPGSGSLTRRVTTAAISSIQPEILLAGGAAAVTLLGLAAYAYQQSLDMAEGEAASAEAAKAGEAHEEALQRSDAVLVFGAGGRVGRRVVQKLVQSGRSVVAAVRNVDKATRTFEGLGLQPGRQEASSGLLFLSAADVTKPETLTAELFEGVTQVVSALGVVSGRLPDGGFGVLDGMSSEVVEGRGFTAVVEALQRHVQRQTPQLEEVLSMRSAEDLAVWQPLNDVIMGGASSSELAPAEDGSGAIWKGTLVVEGGGFCGTRTSKLDLDWSAYDGVVLRIKGDPQTFKLNIKTLDQEDIPESTYQTTFDTDAFGWSTVYLPWHSFVPVKRAQWDPEGEPLDPARISKLGLVLSRFEFNKVANPNYRPGPFTLQLEGGFRAFRSPRPQLILVSSAGVERNALIGDDAERRKADIPIVQLNPGGTLNYKFAAETLARGSGYAYTVVRPVGLSDDAAPALLEVDQGDKISGRISRDAVADVIVNALLTPESAFKTFELRHSESRDAQGRSQQSSRDYLRLFLRLAEDRQRWRVGLPPFPLVVAPPPPVSEERLAEILADPRVKARQEQVKAQEVQQQHQAEPAAKETAAAGR